MAKKVTKKKLEVPQVVYGKTYEDPFGHPGEVYTDYSEKPEGLVDNRDEGSEETLAKYVFAGYVKVTRTVAVDVQDA